jgi:MATE family multidrug resistance protein
LASVVPLAGLAAIVIFVGANAFIELISPAESIAPLATGYMRARTFGMMGITAAASLSSFFRGVGDTRTPLVATLIANVANLFLDLGLVYGWFGFPKLGVVGAGIATSISEWLYFALVMGFFLRPAVRARFDTHFRPPNWGQVKRLWRIGIPSGGQWTIEMAAYATFTAMVARMGDAPMAASHAFIQLLSLSFMQAVGISMAATTLVGRYIGAGQLEYVTRSFRSAIYLGSALALVIAVLFFAIPDLLIGLFSTNPEVLAYGGPLLVVGAGYQFLDAIAIVSDGSLRGAGDTRVPFVVRCLLSWLVFLPLAYLFAFPFGWGLTGAWVGGLISMVFLAGFLFVRFRSGAWRRIRI